MLKCSHCGEPTLHIVSDMNNPNDAQDYGVPIRPVDEHDLNLKVLKALGVRLVYVPDLGMNGLILLKRGLVLIEASLSPEQVGEVVVQALDAARK